MPANQKYLTTSIGQCVAKLTSGIIGGYILASLVHIIIAQLVAEPKIVIATSMYSIFLVWMVLLLLPFLFKNGWKALLWYVLSIVMCSVLVYLLKI